MMMQHLRKTQNMKTEETEIMKALKNVDRPADQKSSLESNNVNQTLPVFVLGGALIRTEAGWHWKDGLRRMEPSPAPEPLRSPVEPLSLAEIKLMADAMNGGRCWFDLFPGRMSRLINDGGSIRGYCGLIHEIEDAIALNRLDEIWEVDGWALLDKLQAMSVDSRRVLVLGIAEFWDCATDEADLVLERLVRRLQSNPEAHDGVVDPSCGPIKEANK